MDAKRISVCRGKLRYVRLAQCHASANGGFALVIALGLMSFVILLLLSLTTFVRVETQSSAIAMAQLKAEQNALLALQQAIGELQKQAGLDTRVTARADILDEAHPPIVGVWRSWEGSNHNAEGMPISPGDYAAAKKMRFLAWLTSGPEQPSPDSDILPVTVEGPGTVRLVGENSVGAGNDAQEIHLEPRPLAQGGFAWWVSGENQKARLPQPAAPEADDVAGWQALAKSHAVSDTQPFDLDGLLQDPEPATRVSSLAQVDLLAAGPAQGRSREFFHDLSVTSVGLLTNTATGGWRKDLSLLTENWDNLPASFSSFQLDPATVLQSTKPSVGNIYAERSILYPWADYPVDPDPPQNVYNRHGPVTSWHSLMDYATIYKRMNLSADGNAWINEAPQPLFLYVPPPEQGFNYLHRNRIIAIIARFQWVYSHAAVQSIEEPDKLEPRLLQTPVITLWNPYNVEVRGRQRWYRFRRPHQPRFAWEAGPQYWLYSGVGNYTPALATTNRLMLSARPDIEMKPGETRVFSPADTADYRLPSNQQGTATYLNLVPSPFSPGTRGGILYPVLDAAGEQIVRDPSETVPLWQVTFHESPVNSSDVRTDIDELPDDGQYDGRRLNVAYRWGFDSALAEVLYPPIPGNQLAERSLEELYENGPLPFLSTMFGSRMASSAQAGMTPAKGFLQTNPLTTFTVLGSHFENKWGHRYKGNLHPINAPFDYSFLTHADASDSLLPQSDPATDRGYIITGFEFADGLSRVPFVELPTRPLYSLAELQHWDLRNQNPVPPFALNLIGNSSALPLVPSGAVTHPDNLSQGAMNLQFDDSYSANHLLFDDWFFSSIAPDPSPGRSRTMRTVFTDFITGKQPLHNRAYRPLAADRSESEAAAGQLYDDLINPADAYESIASRILVEGMFNVNSTSVTAWRALLGHAREQRVPYYTESGGGWNAALSTPHDYPYSRFSISADVEAGDAGTAGARLDASEYVGYQTFTDAMLNRMAELVVEEVRQRGPFLSLAEFINRQLSSGDLALAGTIQSALDGLAASGAALNPYSAIQAGSEPAQTNPPGDPDYQFPAAAEGSSVFGIPGWIRQADVLRPLAPILTARDDTFTIRAYGDIRDLNGDIVARAVCEAVVRRSRDWVDSTDAAERIGLPISSTNQAFGRRFEVVAFRWLNPSEI